MEPNEPTSSPATEPTPPTLKVMYYDGVPSYSCVDCDEALGDNAAARAHLLARHPATGTRYRKDVVGFACGARAMGVRRPR